jgi:hypothetical protein
MFSPSRPLLVVKDELLAVHLHKVAGHWTWLENQIRITLPMFWIASRAHHFGVIVR